MVPRRDLKVRITESLHERLTAECGHCGCSLNAVVTLAIAREIALRQKRRKEAADHAILVGQLRIESMDNA